MVMARWSEARSVTGHVKNPRTFSKVIPCTCYFQGRTFKKAQKQELLKDSSLKIQFRESCIRCCLGGGKVGKFINFGFVLSGRLSLIWPSISHCPPNLGLSARQGAHRGALNCPHAAMCARQPTRRQK